jgi:hypothetical protein
MGKQIDEDKLVREEIEWQDRKRTLFGLPWSFTVYSFTKTKLVSKIGLFTTTTNEILLYRILDIEMRKTLYQKIFRIGSIHLFTADPSSPNFTIKSVKRPDDVKNYLSTLVNAEREERGVAGREMFGVADGVSGDADGSHSDHPHGG